jgi:hypothetical protein
MVLVDTSVWVSHLRETHTGLVDLLNDGEVACHPFIVGELACGNLKNRTIILALLEALPMTLPVEHKEVLGFIEGHDLIGKGLGYIDRSVSMKMRHFHKIFSVLPHRSLAMVC